MFLKLEYEKLEDGEESQIPPSLIEGLYSRDFACDEVYGPVEKGVLLDFWEKSRWYLLIFFTCLPFFVFSMEFLRDAWIMSILGFVGCLLPSGGAPVGGGIVFIPVLLHLGLQPRQCVAFTACAQAVGCGIFTPLNWAVKDPSIFIKSSLPVCLTSATIGLIIALFILPLDDKEVEMCFTGFCIVLTMTVIHGLFNKLIQQNESFVIEKPFTFHAIKSWILCVSASIVGGMIVGWIGLGIEKIFFILATSYYRAEVNRATITAISIVGWLSFVSTFVHVFVLQDTPVGYFICTIPGLLLGSLVGPVVNRHLGSRNVMIAFCIFMVINIGNSLVSITTKGRALTQH